MDEFKNWTEVTKGLYRYVISSNVAYEIHLCRWFSNTDILTAKANLYIVGDWYEVHGVSYFARDVLTEEQPVLQCIKDAVKDNRENNS